MIEVLDLIKAANRSVYTEIINGFNSKRPYDSLEFIENFSDGFENLTCIKYDKDGTVVLLLGYLRKIHSTNYKDFVSPYGYSGLIYRPETKMIEIENAWREIKGYCDEYLVSSFIRFSLDTNYEVFKEGVMPLMKNIRGVILDYETQWTNFDNKVRKNVKRAKREHLGFEIIEGNALTKEKLDIFYSIYVDTMKRNNATDKYFFSLDNFSSFVKTRGELAAFCFIYDRHKVVSVEMVLRSNDAIFSFLGGTLEEAFKKRPNDFLKYVLINWARENNIKYFVLGGGYGSEDGIYNYKKSFFPNDVVDYCTGQFIHNLPVYNELSKNAKDKFLNKPGNNDEEFNKLNFFPLYRAI
jgi:hypothetical protein